MNILITGIGGLIGGRLAQWIKANYSSANVVGIDDFSGGFESNVPEGIKTYVLNLGTGKDIKRIFEQNEVEYVFHFAAYAAECLSPFIRKFNYQNNLLATAEIINACINCKIKRLVFTSSVAVYGDQQTPYAETLPYAPIDPYGVAKMACEMDIKIAGVQHQLDYCILRPHNVYGRGQNLWDKYRNVIGIWMRQILENKSLTIFGDGLQQRAFSYIDDALPAIFKSAIQDNCSRQIINVGGTKEYSIKEAAETLKKITGSGNIVYLEPRHEVKQVWTTFDKSERLLDYKDNTSLEAGISDMWKWAKSEYIKYPNRQQLIMPREVDQGIYEYWK